MRFIAKGREPRELSNWKYENRDTPQNLDYSGGGFPLEAVRRALLLEQFHLCAYTMRRLPTKEKCTTKSGVIADKETALSCHVEHLYPQSIHPAQSIDFTNMLACFPPSQGSTYCDFGAVKKADYDPGDPETPFLSPLSANSSRCFRFQEDGSVVGLTEDAKTTINVLNLNAPILVNDRKAVIRGALKPNGRFLRATEALQVVRKMGIPDSDQRLPAYCEAIRQLAQRHAQKQQGREAAIRRQRR